MLAYSALILGIMLALLIMTMRATTLHAGSALHLP
jgi:hypothetical protein